MNDEGHPETEGSRWPRGSITIEAQDDQGNTTETRETVLNDWVNNWYKINAALLTGNVKDFTIEDEDGNTTNIDADITGNDTGLLIEIGDGTTSFSQSDTTLDSNLASQQISATSVDTSNRELTFSASFSFNNAQTITETCIKLGTLQNSSSSSINPVLVERSVFTGVDVPAGGSISIEYTVTWA